MGTRIRLLPGAPPVSRTAAARFHTTPPRPAPWMLHGRRLPAGPVHWAVFQPNAVGRGEITTTRGLAQRQRLKAAGQYLGERVLVVVGGDEVAVWPLLWRRMVLPCALRRPLDRLLAVPVAPERDGDPTWPAAVLVDLGLGTLVAELRAVRHDAHSRAVVAALAAD